MKDNNVFLPAQNFFKEFPWVPRIPCWHPCLNYFSTYPENLSTVIYQSFGKSKSVTVKKIFFNRGFSIQYGQFQQRNILSQVTIWHLWKFTKDYREGVYLNFCTGTFTLSLKNEIWNWIFIESSNIQCWTSITNEAVS